MSNQLRGKRVSKELKQREHYLSIFAKFGSEKELTQWYQDNIAAHAGYGKPVFSWSMDDESGHRDTLEALTEREAKLVEALESIWDGQCNCTKCAEGCNCAANIAKTALAAVKE